MARGKAITRTEDIMIRLAVDRGVSVIKIAAELGRSRDAINKRIQRMKKRGEFEQLMLDLGLADE